MINYRTLTDLPSIKNYLQGVTPVAFDFETAPDDAYRMEPKAALDANKAHIVSVSFSTSEGNAINVPLQHCIGENCEKQEALWAFLKTTVFENPSIVKSLTTYPSRQCFCMPRVSLFRCRATTPLPLPSLP